jgi:hypothetical protein
MLQQCVRTVLASDHPSFEVVVADQSEDPTTLDADPRVVHLHLDSVGKSAALNAGIDAAAAPTLAFTDDDCTVPAQWLSKGTGMLERYPELSLLFGDLKPMEHDPEKVFVPGGTLGRFQILAGRAALMGRGGAGANCFAPRRLFEVIGGWDELIGPGSRFRSCEEFDLYYRTAAAGLSIARVPSIEVVHWGARPCDDGSAETLLLDYAYGEGGVVGKHLRLGDLRILWQLVKMYRDDALYCIAERDASGVRYARRRSRGLAEALARRVDHDRGVFRAP